MQKTKIDSQLFLDLINEITMIYNQICKNDSSSYFLAGYNLSKLQGQLIKIYLQLEVNEKNAISSSDSIEEIKE
jgi:hypothetical protein